MENKIFCWEIVGFIFVVIAGTILHFVYDWTGHNRIVGIFSPVNESTWEHLKLLFVPMLLYSIVECFAVGKNYPNFIAAKSVGIILGMLVIVIVFYTYTGIIGEHFLWADILTFIFGVAVAYKYSWRIINRADIGAKANFVGIVLVLFFAACFAIFTFIPPHIELFLDPATKEYGVSNDTLSQHIS